MAPILIPAISLIADIAPELLRLFGSDKAADVAEKVTDVAKKITGKDDNDEAVNAIKSDPTLAFQLRMALMTQQKELELLAFEETKAFIADTSDARKYRDDKTFWLGVAILCTFAMVIVTVLYGGYEILRGGVTVEAGMFAAITGFIGTLVGYVAANAQQVVGFFFGSSKGSGDKTDAMAEAIKHFKGQK